MTPIAKRLCAEPGCISDAVARGRCMSHYQAWRGKAPVSATEKFAQRLANDVEQSGLSKRAVAKLAGIQPETLTDLLYGRTSALPKTAASLAEALSDEALVDIALSERTRNCEKCGAPFTTSSTNNARRRFCSTPCQTAAFNARDKERQHAIDRLTKNRLRTYQEAIKAFCEGCEPLGLCRDLKCELRDVSPLPFVPLHSVAKRVA